MHLGTYLVGSFGVEEASPAIELHDLVLSGDFLRRLLPLILLPGLRECLLQQIELVHLTPLYVLVISGSPPHHPVPSKLRRLTIKLPRVGL